MMYGWVSSLKNAGMCDFPTRQLSRLLRVLVVKIKPSWKPEGAEGSAGALGAGGRGWVVWEGGCVKASAVEHARQ